MSQGDHEGDVAPLGPLVQDHVSLASSLLANAIISSQVSGTLISPSLPVCLPILFLLSSFPAKINSRGNLHSRQAGFNSPSQGGPGSGHWAWVLGQSPLFLAGGRDAVALMGGSEPPRMSVNELSLTSVPARAPCTVFPQAVLGTRGNSCLSDKARPIWNTDV